MHEKQFYGRGPDGFHRIEGSFSHGVSMVVEMIGWGK